MKTDIRGRSMIEMIGVLMIVGLIGSGSFLAYGKAMDRYRINTMIDQVTQIVSGTRNAFNLHDSRGYKSLDFQVKALSDKNYNNRKISDKLKLFPESIVRNNYKNVYDGEIQYFVDGAYKNDDGKAFVLEFYGIPTDACIELVTKNWQTGLGLIAMKVKGSSNDGSYSIQNGTFKGKCTTKYKQGIGLFCASDFPITLDKAVAVCDYVKNNQISWKFF